MAFIDTNNLRPRVCFDTDETGHVKKCMVVDWDDIKNAPTADVAPVKHAQWVKVYHSFGDFHYECSNCGREIYPSLLLEHIERDYPYCHCGAKMHKAIDF